MATAFAFVALFTAFSVTGTHDFMELKRAQNKAQDYLAHEIKADPCRVDGGFEFNGYHCYSPDFKAREGLSWWWVSEESYLITLGPLPGFRVIRSYPFQRYLARDGEVCLLKTVEPSPARKQTQ